MANTYVTITREEMEAVLFPFGFKQVITNGHELVYDRVTGCDGIASTLRVFSSVDMHNDHGRKKGQDRIRIVLIRVYRDWAPNSSVPKRLAQMNRVMGWKSRLQEKLLDLIRENKLHNTETCAECGHEANGYTDDGTLACSYHQLFIPNESGGMKCVLLLAA